MAGFPNAAYRVFDERSQARVNAEWGKIRTGGIQYERIRSGTP